MAAPTFMRGLRLANGSWKIICMRLRCSRRARLAELEDILAVEQHRAAQRLDQPHHRAAGRRLAAAGFADQRQRLAGLQAEGDVLDRVHPARDPAEQAGADIEARRQVGDLEHRPLGGARPCRASRSARPTRRWRGRRPESASAARCPSIEPSRGTAESSERV